MTDLLRARTMRRMIMHPNVPRARKAKHWRDYRAWLAEHNYAEVWKLDDAAGSYQLVALVPHSGKDFS